MELARKHCLIACAAPVQHHPPWLLLGWRTWGFKGEGGASPVQERKSLDLFTLGPSLKN